MDNESNAKITDAIEATRTAITELFPECDFKAKGLELVDELADIAGTVIDATPVGTAAEDAVEELDKLAKGSSKPKAAAAKKQGRGMALTSIAVSGTYKNPDGTNATGNVTFQLNQVLQNATGAILADRKPVVAVLSSGVASTTLYATNDVGTLPLGATYQVVENIAGSPVRFYNMAVPAAGGAINLATVAPSTAVPPTAATSNLQDVSKTAPTDQQVLVYVAATGMWTPTTLSGVNPGNVALAGGTMTGTLNLSAVNPFDLTLTSFRVGDTFKRMNIMALGREQHGGPGNVAFPTETPFVGAGNIGNEAQFMYWMTNDVARGMVIQVGGNPTYFSTTDVRFPFMVIDKNRAPITWVATDSGGLGSTDAITLYDTSLNRLISMGYRHAAIPKSLPAIIFGNDPIVGGFGDTGDPGTGSWFGWTSASNVYLSPHLTTRYPITLPVAAADTDSARFDQVSRQLASSVGTTTVVNTTTPTNIMSSTITGAVAGDRYRLIARGDYFNNSGSAVTFTMTIKIGATTVVTSDAISIPTGTFTKQWVLDLDLLEYTDTAHQDVRAIWTMTAGSANGMANMPAAVSVAGAAGGGQSTVNMTTNPALSVQIAMGTANALAQFRVLSWSLERIR